MHTTNIRQHAIRGVAWTFLQKWAARLATVATFVVLARILDPRDFGVVALAAVFVGVVSSLADAGFASYLVQARTLDQRTSSTAFWSVMALSLTLASALWLSAPFWAFVLDTRELDLVLRWLSLAVIFTGLSSVQVALLKRRLAFKTLAIRSLVSIIVSCVAAVTMALLGAGVWSLVAQSLVQSFTSAIFVWSSAKWSPSLSFHPGTAHQISKFGSKVAVSQIVLNLKSQGDDLVIGVVLGPVALGYWTIASRLLRLLIDSGIAVISVVATPVFARLKDDRPRLRTAYVQAVSTSLAIMAPALLTVSLLSSTIVPLLFGAGWTQSGDLATIITLSGLATTLVYFDRGMMLALNQPGTELKLALATTVTGWLLVAAVSPLGLTAIAIAVVVRSFAIWPIRLRVTSRLLDLRPSTHVKRLALITSTSLLGTVPAAMLLIAARGTDVDLLAVLAVPVLVFLTSAVLTRRLLPDMWNEVKGLSHRLIRRQSRQRHADPHEASSKQPAHDQMPN